MLWTDPVYWKCLGWLALAVFLAFRGDAWWKRRQQEKKTREGRVTNTSN